MGSTSTSAKAPNGAATAAAAVMGPTSRQLQRGNSRIVSGALPARSISSSVGAAMRGS